MPMPAIPCLSARFLVDTIVTVFYLGECARTQYRVSLCSGTQFDAALASITNERGLIFPRCSQVSAYVIIRPSLGMMLKISFQHTWHQQQRKATTEISKSRILEVWKLEH